MLATFHLPIEDLEEIGFYKKKHVIDDYFKAEKSSDNRKRIYKKLLLTVHPDHEKSSSNHRKADTGTGSYVLEYLLSNKAVFKGHHSPKLATVLPVKFAK